MENGEKMRCRSMKSARKTSASSRVIIMFRLHSWRAITTRCQDLRHIQLARLRLWCMRNEKFNFFIFTEKKENYNSIRCSVVVILSLPLVLLFLMMLLNDKMCKDSRSLYSWMKIKLSLWQLEWGGKHANKFNNPWTRRIACGSKHFMQFFFVQKCTKFSLTSSPFALDSHFTSTVASSFNCCEYKNE